jgi:hypothetical protein
MDVFCSETLWKSFNRSCISATIVLTLTLFSAHSFTGEKMMQPLGDSL